MRERGERRKEFESEVALRGQCSFLNKTLVSSDEDRAGGGR